jgi:hypothetical protein
MADSIIRVYNQGGYTTSLDAESVTSTIGSAALLRQRIQISARDVNAGTPTDVGDATNQAIRVNVVQGSFAVSANPNVTITNWTYANAITVTGNLTASVNNVSVTNVVSVSQNSTPWTVTFTAGTWPVTGTVYVTPSAGAQFMVSPTGPTFPVTVTMLVVTPSLAFPVSLTTALPWPVTFSAPQPVSLSQVVLSSNVAPTTPTGPAVQTLQSLAQLLVPLSQVVSTTAASATIVPGVSNQRIFVTGYHLLVGAPTTITWIDSGATPAGLTGPLAFAANSGAAPTGSMDSPLFAVVTPGNGLKISQSTTASLGGVVTYYQF